MFKLGLRAGRGTAPQTSPAPFFKKKPSPQHSTHIFENPATPPRKLNNPAMSFSSKIWQNQPFLSDFFIDIWPFLTKIFNFRVIFCLKTLVYSTKFFIIYRRMEKTNDFIHYKCICCLNQFFINKILPF